MHKPTKHVLIVAAAGLLAAPVMAQHPRPMADQIHLQAGGTANPPTMDIKNAHNEGSVHKPQDATKYLDFDKQAGGAFTVKFAARSPCVEPSIGSSASRRCTIKPNGTACRATYMDVWDANKKVCVFHYTTGNGDPDIEIDPGYNPPPPPKPDKGKKKAPPPKQ